MKQTLPTVDWTGNTGFRTITKDNLDEAALAVLKCGFDDIYLPFFPREAGYHNWEEFKAMLIDPDNSPVDLRAIVAGDNLGDPDNAKVQGIAMGFYYKGHDVAQLTYVAVDPNVRTKGLGYALFKHYEASILEAALSHGGELKGHFITCQDPNKPKRESHAYDVYDPQKRLEKYIQWGGELYDFEYNVAYMHEGEYVGEKENVLLGLRHPTTGLNPDIEAVKAYLYALWTSGGLDPKNDSRYTDMIGTLYQNWPRAVASAAASTPSVPLPPGK